MACLECDELLYPLCALPGDELAAVRLPVDDGVAGANGAVGDRLGVAVEEVDGVSEVGGRSQLGLLSHLQFEIAYL